MYIVNIVSIIVPILLVVAFLTLRECKVLVYTNYAKVQIL